MTVGLANQKPLPSDIADWLSPIASSGASLSVTVVAVSASIGLPADDQTPFEREKVAFQRRLPQLAKYRGQFVAIHNGELVDTDPSRNALVRRFFERYGDRASVYVGFVGGRPAARIPTPFITRR